MGDPNFWFEKTNINNIDNRIKSIINEYEEIIKEAMNISAIMSEYINAPGKWNDDNSNVLARWWNNDGDATTNGKLTNSEEEGVKIVADGNVMGNGEDRIRVVLNQCSYSFWLVVCHTLYVIVNENFSKTEMEFSPIMFKCMGKGKENLANVKPTSDTWNLFMQSFITNGSSVFKKTTLPVKNAKGGSKDTEISNFMTKISWELNGFFNKVMGFCTSLSIISDDEDKGQQFFGLKNNTKVRNAYKDLRNLAEANVNDLKDNLKTAVSNYSGMVSKQFAEYFATPFDGNY